jgi:hypothetical protein
MESSAPQPPTFTLRSLFVVIGIVCLGLAMFFPWLRKSHERQYLIQCTDNLKQMGLAVQNFHDIRQEIVPSYLTDDHSAAAAPHDFVSWPLLLYPFMEQPNIYSLVDVGTPLNVEPGPSANHTSTRSTSLPMYFCPARRFPPIMTRDGMCATGDYACVSRADLSSSVAPSDTRTWDAAMLVSRAFNASTIANTVKLGDFQPGTLGGRDFRGMTTFADITDGLSYTAFIGEKAVHADRLGGDPSGAAKTQLAGQQDGTFYYGSGGNPANLTAPGAIAYWSRRLAPVSSKESLLPQQPRSEDPKNRFGGWHGGLTLFLMGDGSVRGIGHRVSTTVLQRLGCRNDGYKGPLPPDAAQAD